MRFLLEIELGNDAMQTPADLARSLQVVVGELAILALEVHRSGPELRLVSSSIRDDNGNTVGSFRFEESESG